MTQHRLRIMSRAAGFAAVGIGLACGGCTITAQGVSPTTVTMQRPGALPALPPPPPAPPAPAIDGVYEGTGTLSGNPGGACRTDFAIRNFVVTGDRVRFQSFRGRIQPDQFLQMQAGVSFIHGSFDGGTFTGRLWRPQPSCTYDIALKRVE